jgi:hypothetical protein
MGLLGAITYVWLVISAANRGWAVWRRHPDGVARVAGLAMGAGVLGLAAVELTSTVIGADQRGGTIFGVVLGLLAVAHGHLRPTAAAPSVGTLA